MAFFNSAVTVLQTLVIALGAGLGNPGQIASIASQRKQTVASYLNEWVESYAD